LFLCIQIVYLKHELLEAHHGLLEILSLLGILGPLDLLGLLGLLGPLGPLGLFYNINIHQSMVPSIPDAQILNNYMIVLEYEHYFL
jgi:hypothetical protein